MKKESEYHSSLGLLNGLMKQCQCNAKDHYENKYTN